MLADQSLPLPLVEESICSIEWCRRVEALPIKCDLCHLTFCSTHFNGSNYEAHSCKACISHDGTTFRNPRDVRIAVCPYCDLPISRSTVVASVSSIPRALVETEAALEKENLRISQLIHNKMHQGSELRAMTATAWTLASATSAEDDVRDSLPEAELALARELRQRKEDILLAMHLEKCVALGDGSAPSQQQQKQRSASECRHKGCKETKGFKMMCKGCGSSYCLSHRLPEVHNCVSLAKKITVATATTTAKRPQSANTSTTTPAAAFGKGPVQTNASPAALAAMMRAQQQAVPKPDTVKKAPSPRVAATVAKTQQQQALSDQENQLLSMGFPIEAVRAALSRAKSVEAALEILVR